MTIADVILRWWRDDKGQDYMGSAEGFVNELLEAIDSAGYEIVPKKNCQEPVE